MPRDAPLDEVLGEDDVVTRATLTGMSMLMFVVARGHKNHKRAKRLDRELRPVRERARDALIAYPARRSATPAARAAVAECWVLLDRAGETIDAERKWWLRPGDSTRAWAQRRIDGAVRRALKASPRR